MSGKKYKKRRQSDTVLTALLGISVAALAVLISFFAFQVDDYEVRGNYHETDSEIIESLMEGTLGHNAIYLTVSNRDRKVAGSSFIDTITVNMKSPRSIEVVVKEKALVGYVYFDDHYWYFDRTGMVQALSKYSQADFNIMADGGIPVHMSTVENAVTAGPSSDASVTPAQREEGMNASSAPGPDPAAEDGGEGLAAEDVSGETEGSEETAQSGGDGLPAEDLPEETDGGPETAQSGEDGESEEYDSGETGDDGQSDEYDSGENVDDSESEEYDSGETGDESESEEYDSGETGEDSESEEYDSGETGDDSESEEYDSGEYSDAGEDDSSGTEESNDDGQETVITPQEIVSAGFMGRILPQVYMEGAGAAGSGEAIISFEESGSDVIAPVVIVEDADVSAIADQGTPEEEILEETEEETPEESEEEIPEEPEEETPEESEETSEEETSEESEEETTKAREEARTEQEETQPFADSDRSTQEDLLRSESGDVLVYIPLIEGLSFSRIEVGQTVPGQSSRLFDMLDTFRTYAMRTGNIPDRICVGKNQDLSVFYGGAEVRLGTGEELEARLNELRFIDPYLEDLTGVLHLENFDGSQDEVIFSKK